MNEADNKENTDENQRKITNPICIRTRGRPQQKRFKSSLETSHTNAELRTPLGNANQNDRSEITASNGSNNGLNNSKQLKKCGRCKQYTTHNRRTCKVDLST